ncbi:MAG: DUF4214 domain-containing protein [Sulfitobacter sp.]|nr:DUF4214 domain-containing protein [Sulfitobacter sp.]
MAVSLISTLGGELGFGGNLLPRNDDGSTDEIDLSSVFENGLNFFGETYTSLYVNNNGGVSFNAALSTFTPQTISSGTTPGVFPFWADVDTDGLPGTVSPGGSSQGSNLVYYTLDTANDRFVVTWDDVGYYSENTDRVNAFQLILEDQSTSPGRTAGDFDIEVRYEWIDWTAGDASEGEGGLGGVTARAGYSAGNGIFFELPQAGDETAMLALESTPGNTGIDGLWRWGVFNGNVPPTLSINSAGDVTEGDSGITTMSFLLQRTGDLEGTLEVEWSADGFRPSAANSADVDGLLPRGGMISFAEGETLKTIEIGIQGDTNIENDENIVVTLRNAVSSTGEAVNFTSLQGFGRIINDDFPPPPGSGFEAEVFGDPHLITLDSLGYDFQAVGEFTLIRATSGDPLNVQVRMAPISDLVSVITAMATEVNGTRIMLDATRDTPLSIDGVATSLSVENSPLSVGTSGAQIYENGGVYTLIMPSGDQFMVGIFDNGTLNVCTFLSDSRAPGSVQGLLGNADGNGTNDLALPDGTVLTQPVDFATLYTTYADAWRITEPEALFDRAPGETTSNYQDSSYPRGYITVDDLPADIRAAAEAEVQAAGITNPIIAENAVLDFALTGDLSFVTGATMLAGSPTSEAEPGNTPSPLPTLLITSEDGHAEGDAGSSTFRFTIDRLGSTSGTLDISYTIEGDVDASDIDGSLSGIVSFADSETEKTLEIAVRGDTDVEEDEELTLSIDVTGGASVLFANRSATTLVLDDDGADSLIGTPQANLLQGDLSDNLVLALAGNDTVTAGAGNDDIFGDAGDDSLTGGQGDDQIDGGTGSDTAAYSGAKAAHTVSVSASGIAVEDRRSDGDGTDQLTSIESLSFLDGDWPLDIFDNVADLTEQAFRDFIEVYIAYFNRSPDAEGLFFYGTAFANGTSLEDSAATFLNSAEYQATYPPGLSNQEFAEAVYNNVLGRIPDVLGLEFWVGVLNSGARSRDVFILEVLKGAKAPAPDDATQDFIDQKAADVAYLANKTDIGLYFAVTKGMSNVTNATTAMQLFDDGDQSDIDAAVAAIDGFYADALDPTNGEFLLQLVGVVDDPFMI